MPQYPYLLVDCDARVKAKGRVPGNIPSDVCVKINLDGDVRADDLNSPEFWMEFSMPNARRLADSERCFRRLTEAVDVDPRDGCDTVTMPRDVFERFVKSGENMCQL